MGGASARELENLAPHMAKPIFTVVPGLPAVRLLIEKGGGCGSRGMCN